MTEPAREAQPSESKHYGNGPQSGPFLKLLDGATLSLNVIGTLWIGVIMIVVCADIFARWLFNSPLNAVPLVVAFSIIGIVYLQLAQALRSGRWIQSDAVYNRMIKSFPFTGNLFAALVNLLGAVFMSIIWINNIPRAIIAYERGFFKGSLGDVTLPQWPLEVVVVIGCILVTAHFLVRVWTHGRDAFDTSRRTNIGGNQP